MAHGQTGASFALKELDSGLLVLPVRAKELHGAREICGKLSRGEHLRKRASTKRLEEFVFGQPWY
jgi:hypothetical protein